VSDPERRALQDLAVLYGIETRHVDGLVREVEVGRDTLLALLRVLGAPLESPAEAEDAARRRLEELARRVVEPVVVRWEGSELALPVFRRVDGPLAWTLTLEDGEVLRGEIAVSALPADSWTVRLDLGAELPVGYHRLELESRGWSAATKVISAPVQAHQGAEGRLWGAVLPLHALRSRESWGIGDLSDLGRLADWAAGLGASAIASLPLLPTFLGRPFDPSPYAPLSRRFWHEIYLDPRRLPGFERSVEARRIASSADFLAEVEALEAGRWVDYRRALALKLRVCRELAGDCFRRGGEEEALVRRYAAGKPLAAAYAAFRAVNDRLGEGWQGWPERQRDGRLEEGDFAPEDRWLHLWMQWALDSQLGAIAAAAERAGAPLYLDFPLGVHAGGFDVWHDRDLFAQGASAGAPPDSLFRGGQEWGLPPLLPERLRTAGYDYLIDCLRHHLAPAGLLRIDHVMQLHRLYWVPAGLPAAQGAYVRQPAEELLAVLCLESARHATAIVGENLGTVPAKTGEALHRHGLLGLFVLQYELRPESPPTPPPEASVAALNTHDMPTFRGFCEGRDLDDFLDLGLLSPADHYRAREEREALLRSLRSGGSPSEAGAGEASLADLLRRQLAWLADSPARWLMVNLEDLWAEGEPHNVPGTSHERPNWLRRASLALEGIEGSHEVAAALREIDARRRSGAPAEPPVRS
jgi:4-alpha-glucanotransferase